MRRPTAIVALVAIAALVLIGAFAAVSIQGAYDSDLRTEASKLSATAAVTAELISRELGSIEVIGTATVERSNFVAAFGSGQPGQVDLGALQAVLDQVQRLRPGFQFVAAADAAGNAVGVSPVTPSVIGKNFSYRDWYKGVSRTGKPYVSTAYVSAVPGAPLVVAVAIPIRATSTADILTKTSPSGPAIGALFIGYKIGSIQLFTDHISSVERVNLDITDQAGVLVAREGGITGQLTRLVGAPEVDAALRGQSGITTTSTLVSAGSPVPDIGWAVRASTPIAATAAAAQRKTTGLLGTGLLIFLIIGALAVVVGTSRLARANARHAASEAQLEAVLGSLTESIAVYDTSGQVLSANPATERLLRFQSDESAADGSGEGWEQIREDATVLPDHESPLATAIRTGRSSEGIILGIRRISDKAVRWLSVSTVPIYGARREISGYVSSSADVTDRVESVRAMRILGDASEDLSASLEPTVVIRALTRAAAAICSVGGEARRRSQVFLVNGSDFTIASENDIAGAPRMEGTNLPIAEHPYMQQVISTNKAVSAVLNLKEFGPTVAAAMKKAGVRNSAWVPIAEDNNVYAVLVVSGRQHQPITPAQLELLTTLGSMGELALNNAKAHQRVSQLAITDPLTGLANRRGLGERMRQLPRIKFAVMAFDVDDLKRINDVHGHAAGDNAIAGVAAAVSRELRPSDVVARIGGDEFLSLLLDCDADGAVKLAVRLKAAVAALKFDWGTPSISLGAAVGKPGDDPELVAKAADAALYQAKFQGKDRFVQRADAGSEKHLTRHH